MSPCENCKRKPNCPERCRPKEDWNRHVRKTLRKRKGVNNG